MKKTLVRKKSVNDEALRSEYRFDHSKSQPNRFAAKMSKETVAVVLEPDAAENVKQVEIAEQLMREERET